MLAGGLVPFLPGSTESPVVFGAEPPADAGRLPEDWTSFRNGRQLQGLAGTTLPEELELLWKHPAPDGFASTAAITGGQVFAASLTGNLMCLDLKTGREIWNYRSIDSTDPDDFAPGFKASPTVTETAVYIGDEDGVFHAVDRKTGKRRWKHVTGGEIVSSATVLDGRVLFGSYDNSLYCLNEKDGTLAWSYATDGYVNCTPAVAGQYTFVTGCDEHLRVIDISTGKQHSVQNLMTYLIASPAVDGNMLYVGTYASEVMAINWESLEVVWRYKGAGRELPYHSSAALTEKYVIAGSRDKRMHCIDRET
ncbi:MAG: PQQ-binding-like beta-propeller repeat protein, partial [Planctomycetaceae bacterium]|nr:PQQ-binding-like beta-propeller repeat protein [Planctomycetaceae bacterium]